MEMRARIPGKRQCSQFQDGAKDKRILFIQQVVCMMN